MDSQPFPLDNWINSNSENETCTDSLLSLYSHIGNTVEANVYIVVRSGHNFSHIAGMSLNECGISAKIRYIGHAHCCTPVKMHTKK
jgi:hypothetical protein